jgi:pimeloyl-ACP methyl ester carboxylesterase
MREEPFAVEVDDGELQGHRGGEGRPALLLHGGPAITDYTAECAELLDGLFETARYTQRGTPPSTVGPPYSIEAHVADAVAVLDALELPRAWAIGHSWGGHLALHLAVAHPDRLLGIVCISPLGAYGDALDESSESLRRGLTEEEAAFVDEVEARRSRGEATEDDLTKRWGLLWPLYFADRAPPIDPPGVGGVDCSRFTNASITAHFDKRTLVDGLPGIDLPALFVHGDADPLPVRTSTESAALIPGAVVATIPECGHFPWLEKPAELRAAIERFLTTEAPPAA